VCVAATGEIDVLHGQHVDHCEQNPKEENSDDVYGLVADIEFVHLG